MFGKLMSLPDELIVPYLILCTSLPEEEVRAVEAGLADGSQHPNEQKRRMAREIIALYHGHEAATAAEAAFDRVFKRHEVPEEMREVSVMAAPGEALWLPRLLAEWGLASSNSDGRRKIEEGAVKLDGAPVTDPAAEFDPSDLAGRVLQVGRRQFVRIVASA
jgi:tyrosyl-tRNA synthetase